MQRRKGSGIVTFSSIGVLLLLLLIGSRIWEQKRLGTPPPTKASPVPPQTILRISDALKKAPYVIRKIHSDRHDSRYYWRSGTLVAAYAKTGGNMSAYYKRTVWESDDASTRGTIETNSRTRFSPEFISWKDIDFKTSKLDEGTFTYYSGTTEFVLQFDPGTYRPLSLKEVHHKAPVPFRRVGQAAALPGRPPTPKPVATPEPTPRPVPYTTNLTTFEYPEQFPIFDPIAQFPRKTWFNYDQEHARWLQKFAHPQLEFQILQSKIGLLHVERNDWGDLFLYLAGNYPFGAGYKKSGEEKIKVICRITIDIDNKPQQYSYPMPIYTPVLPAVIKDRNLRVLVLPNLSLQKMPEAHNFRINFIAADTEGTVVERYAWSKPNFTADFAFTPPQFPIAGETLTSFANVSSNRIELWNFQAERGNLPTTQMLDQLDQLLQAEEKLPNAPPNLELARWRLIQLNRKARRPNVALALAQQAGRAPRPTPTVDWAQVLEQLSNQREGN